MRIAVDVGFLGDHRAGIARYLHNMLVQMLELDTDCEFLLYSSRPVPVELPPGRWRCRSGKGGWFQTNLQWLRRECPRWLDEDRASAFWGQNYLLPVGLRRPCLRATTLHDLTPLVMPHSMPLRSRLAARLQFRRFAERVDVVFADSRATAHLAKRLLSIPTSRLSVVPAGLDRAVANTEPAAAARRVEDRFGLKPGFLLTVCTLEPRKNHTVLLDAHAQLAEAPVLVLVGGGGWRSSSIVARVRRLERAGRVRYLGRTDDADLAVLYAAARLLVYPSLYEGFGLPILEAMANGCPVLSSFSSSLPEVGGDAAVYFDPRDVEGLARQIARLLKDPDQLRDMRERGLEQARQFSYRVSAKAVLNKIRESARTLAS